jgi:arsenate reductase (glutaredoxin)
VQPRPALYFHPSCSKCRTAQSLLKEHEIEATVVRYLDRAPSVGELRILMDQLGFTDPREMMRTGEAIYSVLGLDEASPKRLLKAIAEHPILLERPIFVSRGRAVIARPPERLLELL